MPTDIAVDSLSEYQMGELKEWLYRQRTKIRLERDRGERRHTKTKEEEEVAAKKAEQPLLF